ncbi:MAG: DUF4381 domain-containing protein [Thermodesulfobacteriota bacterium]
MKENSLSIFDLRDIVIPAPAALWPPAPFIWILLGAVGVGMVVLVRWRWVRWRSVAYRREGLARLARIEKRFMTPGSETSALKELTVLLKRVALAAFERKAVAALYGQEWLRFLDQTCEGCTFSTGPGHPLAMALSSGADFSLLDKREAKQLIRQARIWIKGHRRVKTDQGGVVATP